MTLDQARFKSLLKESQEVNWLFGGNFPSDNVRVMKVDSLQVCFVNKESPGEVAFQKYHSSHFQSISFILSFCFLTGTLCGHTYDDR